jgi:hypothetical protein
MNRLVVVAADAVAVSVVGVETEVVVVAAGSVSAIELAEAVMGLV